MVGVRTQYTRSNWYDTMRFNPALANILSEQDDEKHNLLRTKMVAGVFIAYPLPAYVISLTECVQYSGKENDDLEYTIDRNVLALVDLIHNKYISTSSEFKPFDFGRKIQYFSLDVISGIAFGEAFGELATDQDVH